jgi:hypothetical protein
MAAVMAGALSCSTSGDGNLSASAVTNLPNGNGTGTAASGTYEVTINVTSCTGACTASVDGVDFAICTVGSDGTATFTVTQTGGHLVAEVTGSSGVVVPSFAGGINADGSFAIGGVADNVEGQPLDVSSRVDGTLAGNAVTATVESLGSGTVDGTNISCVQTETATGTRTGG